MDNPRLRPAQTRGEIALKVDHAGERGAIWIYRAQRWVARWRAPALVPEIEHFLAHEERHRALFAAELERRGVRRCRSYHLCGLGGLALGLVTGLIGSRSIALTTGAVESVVLSHLEQQQNELEAIDPLAAAVIREIVAEEKEHHETSTRRLGGKRAFDGILRPLITTATEAVIWTGMRAP